MTHDITQIEVRKKIIDEIENNENKNRKEESFRRFEIYRERQAKYILQRLAGETSVNSVRDMRTMTSINLTRKMIMELASIYKYKPTREYTLLNTQQTDTMEAHYKYSKANIEFKQSNRMYKLHEQCAIKIVPKNGLLKFDVLQPHHYDVVPSMDNPEEPEIYIISSFDRSRIANEDDFRQARNRFESVQYGSDRVNQSIADTDDWDNEKGKIYYWWSAEYNFKTDRSGKVLDESNNPLGSVDFNEFTNPIARLPFVDIATEKDYEFWVRTGSNITEFNIDFGVQISDNVNINRMQGYSQAVIKSVEAPKDLYVGPHSVIWLKQDPNDTGSTSPDFQFVTPSPDIQGSLQLSDNLLRYFLVSRSINIKNMLEGTAQATSGVEKLLMMIEKFEASQDDLDLYEWVEQDAYEIMTAWHNVFRDVDSGLSEKVIGPNIPEGSEVMVKFGKPQSVVSDTEKLEKIMKELDMGLKTPVEAIQELREIDEDMATVVYKNIKNFEQMDMSQLIEVNKDIAIETIESDEEI